MSRRLTEVVEEYGKDQLELVEACKKLKIPLDKARPQYSILSDDHVDRIMALLDNDAPAAAADKPAVRRKIAPAAAEKPAAPAAASVVKKKAKAEAEPEVVAPVAAPAPAVKKKAKVEAEVEARQDDDVDEEPAALERPKRRVTAKKAEPAFEAAPVVTAEEPAHAAFEPSPSATLPASPVEAAGAVKRRTFATVQTRQLATPDPEPEAAASSPAQSQSEPLEADEPRRSRFATVVTRSTSAVETGEVFAESDEAEPAAAATTAEPEVRRSRFATVVTRVEGEVAVSPGQPNPMELAALARREADAASRRAGQAVPVLSAR
jgi:hypothetical protein